MPKRKLEKSPNNRSPSPKRSYSLTPPVTFDTIPTDITNPIHPLDLGICIDDFFNCSIITPSSPQPCNYNVNIELFNTCPVISNSPTPPEPMPSLADVFAPMQSSTSTILCPANNITINCTEITQKTLNDNSSQSPERHNYELILPISSLLIKADQELSILLPTNPIGLSERQEVYGGLLSQLNYVLRRHNHTFISLPADILLDVKETVNKLRYVSRKISTLKFHYKSKNKQNRNSSTT